MNPVFAALLLAAAAPAGEEAAVNAAVDAFIAAVNARDEAAFEQLTAPALAIQILSATSSGPRVASISRTTMAASFADKSLKVDERLTSRTTLVQGDIAHVWAPYTLDVNGKRQHCGIDSFGLMKLEGRWLLTNLAWTADPNGCPK